MTDELKARFKNLFKSLIDVIDESPTEIEFSGAIPIGDGWYWKIGIKKEKRGNDGDNE